MKKYDVILADPPWPYSFPNTRSDSTPDDYPTMSIEDICNLPIKNLAAENCALFLWAIWPKIWDAKSVIDAWGFSYRTEAWQWIKAKKTGFGFHFGMGQYTRANSEPCLLAVKGSMPPVARNVYALIYSPVQQHSKKPVEQYGKIDRLYPNANKLELFARRPYPGWDVWGNEVESDITGLPSNYACNGQADRLEF